MLEQNLLLRNALKNAHGLRARSRKFVIKNPRNIFRIKRTLFDAFSDLIQKSVQKLALIINFESSQSLSTLAFGVCLVD